MCLSVLYAACLIHGSKRSFWRQSSACKATEKSQGEKKNKNQSIIILAPFVLQKENTWFLSHVDWNRVDMHECEPVQRGESRVMLSKRERRRGREKWLLLTYSPPLRGLLVTVVLWRRDKQFCFALLPVSLTLSDRRFIVLKSAVFCRLASLLIKAVFFFSHCAARSGDRPLNAML